MAFQTNILRNTIIHAQAPKVFIEIRRRTRVVGAFPDGNSALMLVAARLRYIAGTRWGMKRYLRMERLLEAEMTPAA